MVTIVGLSTSLVAEAAGERLPPPARAAVLMALLGIALLGMLLIVVILLGGHWVRRIGAHRRGPSVPPDRLPVSRPPTDETLASDEETIQGSQAAVDTVRNPPLNRDETVI